MALVVGLLGPAGAITNGQPDGDDHPYVGLLVFDIEVPDVGTVPAWRCSGALIAPDLVLTAGHCTDGAVAARIWFDEVVEGNPEYPYPGSTSVEGTPYTHPDFQSEDNPYGGGNGLPAFAYRDVGLVVLDEPVLMDEYAELPDAGLVDTLKNKTDVDLVGYGVQEMVRGGGVPYWIGDRVRLYAPSELVSGNFVHRDEFMRLSMNPGKDRGGSCFGDSGGPDLLSGTATVLAVNSYVTNYNCTGVGYSARVDVPEVLHWIDWFLDGYRTISVVSTNDFHGALIGRVHSWSHGDVVGSADYLAGYLNIVRQENEVLYLDAGDAMQGTLISNYFDGASTIDVFNQMGVAAMAVGNHEFDWGQEVLEDRLDEADFPFLGANVYYTADGARPAWAQPYMIADVDGIKVGVIGIAHPETPSITNPVNVADLEFTDPVEAVLENIPLVEAEGANLIVVLAHIGGFWPDFAEGLSDLACGLDPAEVDLIVSGHTHSRIDDLICGVPTVQAYSSGTAFARVDFDVGYDGEKLSYEMNAYPVTTYNTYYGDPAEYRRWDSGEWIEVVPDPAVTAIIDGYNAIVADLENKVIGYANTAITRNYRYESTMGDWVTDVMMTYNDIMPVDFAVTNSGGLRADIDAGDVTFGEVFEALPFDNTLVIVELEGPEIYSMLEEGITGDHGVIQVSGLQFTFDYDGAVGSRIVGDVIDLSTGLPIDLSATYYVATNDFMASGGDDYLTLGSNPQTNSYVLVRDMVVDWVELNSPFTPPDPVVEMRMTALGTPPA
jgi:2',3'-cyclic-nucleotide 2'-phosphodiesterase (5'-nucleotidase family)